MLPVALQAQFACITNADNTITITGYIGSDSNVIIPATTNGLPVTSIYDSAFAYSALTSVTIPDSVTTIGNDAFAACFSLTNVTFGNGVTSIGDLAFANTALTSVTLPNSVTLIGDSAFNSCTNLTDVTIPDSVLNIAAYTFEFCSGLTNVTIGYGVTFIDTDAFGYCSNLTQVIMPDNVISVEAGAFEGCSNLTSVYFEGNAPYFGYSIFDGSPFNGDPATVYYLPGTLGWGSAFAGVPIVQWFLPQPLILNKSPNFGVQSNQFGFTISWATNVPVVVEACSNLSNPVWLPVSTNTLVGGTSYFQDPQPANLPGSFYRLRLQ